MRDKTPKDYKLAIQASGKDIYYPIPIGDPDLWIPTSHLELLLNEGLKGLSLKNLPLRTRSKTVKTAVCEALGYPTPKSFTKSRPRFPGQHLDIYTQKSLNLQIWNEELCPNRRYALIQISEDAVILKVKVVNGQTLAILDTTGKITTKYQARLDVGEKLLELISPFDTGSVIPYVQTSVIFKRVDSPTDEPDPAKLLPIQEIFLRLSQLIGQSIIDPGLDQERLRGKELHLLVCKCLGYSHYADNGQFPDIKHQLLEVKLQTSPTVDLGLILPNSHVLLDIHQLGKHQLSCSDIRYAIFYAKADNKLVTLTHLYVTTGSEFFTRFRKFGGKIINGKIQIPLPRNFFD